MQQHLENTTTTKPEGGNAVLSMWLLKYDMAALMCGDTQSIWLLEDLAATGEPCHHSYTTTPGGQYDCRQVVMLRAYVWLLEDAETPGGFGPRRTQPQENAKTPEVLNDT